MGSEDQGRAAADQTESALSAGFTPGPWEYVPSNQHHGPYVTTAADGTYGDIADCYAMSDPSSLSVRNGGSSKPIFHQPDHADANARLIAAAPDLLELARLVYRATPVDSQLHKMSAEVIAQATARDDAVWPAAANPNPAAVSE